MADNFEDRLRQSLQARSEDVTPDPAMYREVQRRIRRGRVARWSLASAGAVAMVAIAALVVPSVLDRRIEFEPAPVATQPPSEHSDNQVPGTMPVPEGMVFTDGRSAFTMALDGESAEPLFGGRPCEGVECPATDAAAAGSSVHDVVARPGASFEDVTVAYTMNDGCHALVWQRAEVLDGGVANRSSGLLNDASCVTTAAFAPEGGHVAWVSAVGPTGAWSLSTVDWTADGPGDGDATFDLGFPTEAVVQIDDWFWTQETDAGAVGSIALSVTRDDERAVYLVDVERQGDGAIAISGEPQRSALHEAYGAAAFADSQSGDGRVSYALLVSRANRQWSVVRSETRTPLGPDHTAQRDLPDAMAPDVPDDLSELWISALGDTVVFGDGQGRAWVMEFSETGGGAPRELPATIVHADLFGGGAPVPEPDGGEVPDDRKLAQVDVHFVTPEGACGEQAAVFQRSVEGSGVLRGALEHLLAGPTAEEIAAGASDQTGFGPETAGYLNDVSIDSDGLARIDFDARLAEQFPSSACGSGALLSMLDPTVRQFPSVTGIIYSFGGNVDAFYNHFQLASPPHGTDVPRAVVRTRDMIRDAVSAAREDDNWDPLAELIDRETFSCSFSDQNEDCIALWQQQEAEGQDPLGPLAEILQGQPAKVDGAPIWAWPFAFVATDEYLGPRTGIQRNGTWRYYQQGGD